MPAYVPPHARNKDSTEVEEKVEKVVDEPPPRDNKGSSKGERDRGKGGYSRSDRGDRDDRFDRDDRGGKGGKDGKKGGRFDNYSDNGDTDWKIRNDGRRQTGEERTELQVFGEIKTRSTAGIDFDKYDAIPVQVSGNRTEEYKPISRFSEGKLFESLFDNLRRCGYDRPTPVQKYSIPIVVSGRDLMACAQTGSGKTCAFMVPCLESLLRSGPPSIQQRGRYRASPCALVLAPTRELAQQIYEETWKFAFDTGIRPCIVYGGAEMREQRMDLEKGCDVLVATPGRLADMCTRRDISLEYIQFFILDEADRMLDMGFEPQVRQIVDSFDMGKRAKVQPRQSMMFSATFARDVQRMASDFLKDYVFITVGRVGSASELVTQDVVFAQTPEEKILQLSRIIKDKLTEGALAIIFVETKKSADQLELDLHHAGVNVTAIHGDRSQSQREEALQAFKTGANPVLVATDVAARGLDIPNVALVVNFDLPKQLDDYVHRIGRTGRAGRKGHAIAFVNERCTYLNDLRDLLINAKQEPPQWFHNLCDQRPGGGKGRRGESNRFGGTDDRLTSDGKNGLAKAVPTPQRAAPPARNENDWGNSGAEDAW